MACECCILSKLFQLTIIYGYPGYKVIKTSKEGKIEKIWVIYFLIMGLLSVLEGTLLFPIIIILNKISRKISPTLKALFHLWLYYPEYRGALLLDQQFGKYFDKAFLKINPILGNILTLAGLENRYKVEEEKEKLINN